MDNVFQIQLTIIIFQYFLKLFLILILIQNIYIMNIEFIVLINNVLIYYE